MPRTKDTVQLNFDIPPAIAAKLKSAAKAADLSLREFIEKLLDYYLAGNRLKSPKKRAILNKMAKSLGKPVDTP